MNLHTVLSGSTLALVAVLVFKMLTGGEELGYGLTPGISMFPANVSTFTEGGGVFSTTTVGTASVLLTENFDDENLIRVTPGGGAGITNVTLSLGASSSFPGLPNPGDTRRLLIENAATVATTTTIAGGTGIDLQEPDGQNVIIGQNNYAFITCFREASTDVVCSVDETIPAD